jgi:hypothetical protein
MEMMKTAPPNLRGPGGALVCGYTDLTGGYKSVLIKGKVLPTLADNLMKGVEINRNE